MSNYFDHLFNLKAQLLESYWKSPECEVMLLRKYPYFEAPYTTMQHWSVV